MLGHSVSWISNIEFPSPARRHFPLFFPLTFTQVNFMFIPLLCSLCYRLPVPAGREADEGRNRCTLGNSRRDDVLYDSFLGTAFQSLILYNTEGWINIPHAHAHANTHHTHIQTHITHTFQYLHNTPIQTQENFCLCIMENYPISPTKPTEIQPKFYFGSNTFCHMQVISV